MKMKKTDFSHHFYDKFENLISRIDHYHQLLTTPMLSWIELQE